MLRTKMALVASCLMVIVAASATPAVALFETEAGKLSGTVAKAEIIKAGEYVYETGSGKVKCPPKSLTIEWSVPTQKSATQIYKVEWGNECVAEIGGSKIAAEISRSELEVKSPESGKPTYTELKGTNVIETQIKTAPCKIKVPAENNKELKKTEQSNLTGFEELVRVNTTGIHAEKSKTLLCPLLASSSTGELKGIEFKVKGQMQT